MECGAPAPAVAPLEEAPEIDIEFVGMARGTAIWMPRLDVMLSDQVKSIYERQ